MMPSFKDYNVVDHYTLSDFSLDQIYIELYYRYFFCGNASFTNFLIPSINIVVNEQVDFIFIHSETVYLCVLVQGIIFLNY